MTQVLNSRNKSTVGSEILLFSIWLVNRLRFIIRHLVFLTVNFLPLPSNVACYNNIFGLSLRCNRLLQPCGFYTFFATSRTKRFRLPSHRRNDLLVIFRKLCSLLQIVNSLKSYDFNNLLPPTQPQIQSVLILLSCEQLCKTSNSISEKILLAVHSSCEMDTFVAFVINRLFFLAIEFLCFALPGFAWAAPSSQPRSRWKLSNAINTWVYSNVLVFTSLRYFPNCFRFCFSANCTFAVNGKLRLLTICVTFGVSPFWLHLNIGLSPIVQCSGEPAFIVSFTIIKLLRLK